LRPLPCVDLKKTFECELRTLVTAMTIGYGNEDSPVSCSKEGSIFVGVCMVIALAGAAATECNRYVVFADGIDGADSVAVAAAQEG